MRWAWSINLHENKIFGFPSNQIKERSNVMPHNILKMCVCFFNASIQSWQEWREKDTLLGHWQKSLLNTTFYENRLSFFHLRNKQALFIEHLFCVRHCSRSCKCSSEQNRLSPYLLGADILVKEKRNKHANLQCARWRGASWRWRAVWWERPGWFGRGSGGPQWDVGMGQRSGESQGRGLQTSGKSIPARI